MNESLLRKRSYLIEKKVTVGAYGGNRYYWPKDPANWEGVDWSGGAGDDIFIQEYQYEENGSFFVKIDAFNWLKKEGKAPVKADIRLIDKVVHSMTIPNLEPKNFNKVFAYAEKLNVKFMSDVKKMMPSIDGWTKTWLGFDEFSYSRDVAGSQSGYGYPGEAMVMFEDPMYVLIAKGKAKVSIDIVGDEYSEKWSSITDVKRLVNSVESKVAKIEKDNAR